MTHQPTDPQQEKRGKRGLNRQPMGRPSEKKAGNARPSPWGLFRSLGFFALVLSSLALPSWKRLFFFLCVCVVLRAPKGIIQSCAAGKNRPNAMRPTARGRPWLLVLSLSVSPHWLIFLVRTSSGFYFSPLQRRGRDEEQGKGRGPKSKGKALGCGLSFRLTTLGVLFILFYFILFYLCLSTKEGKRGRKTKDDEEHPAGVGIERTQLI